MHNNFDLITMPSQGFINGVIDNLPDHVMQSAQAGIADVHAGPLSYRFQTFQYLDLSRSVLFFWGWSAGFRGSFGVRFLVWLWFHFVGLRKLSLSTTNCKNLMSFFVYKTIGDLVVIWRDAS